MSIADGMMSAGVMERAGARTRVSCAHCGLDVPRGLVSAERAEQFCCSGCEAAWRVIHEGGLARYYALREQIGGEGVRAEGAARGFEEFDDPAFHEAHCRARQDGLMEADLRLDGVHCAACVWLLERLGRLDGGVVESRVRFHSGTMTVAWDEGATTLSAIARTLAGLGYRPHAARGGDEGERRAREDRAMLVRVGVSGAIAGNVMLLAISLYGGEAWGIEEGLATLFRCVSAGLAGLALVWPGSVFVRGALAALRARAPHMDLPVALGLVVGYAWGVWNTVRGSGDVYFDTIAMIVFLLLVGRWLQLRQQRKAADAVELLYSLTPGAARRVDEDRSVRTVPVEALRRGDVVETLAGESVPADGVIVRGETALDLSILTGESRPVSRRVGDEAQAGAVNLGAPVRVRVETTGRETRLGRLMGLVEEGAQRRAPIVRTADRVAGRFVVVVVLLAAGTLAVWSVLEPASAVDHTVALLIGACPCALGLATPLAVVSAIGRAARRGLMVRGGDALESLARTGTVVLDKTGTLTQGRMRVERWSGGEEAGALAARAEAGCAHPIARAIVERFGGAGGVEDTLQTLGGGVSAVIDGRSLRVGSPAYVGEACAAEDWVERETDGAAELGLTPVWVGVDGCVAGVAGVGDPLREDARESVARLREMGWRVRILSGDDGRVVRAVGRALGLEDDVCEGGVSPEGKLARVRELAQGGTVVMVGDGVNDAAALASATVGVAVHGGAEASLRAADVYLTRPGLEGLVELVDGSRRTLRVIRRGLRVSLAYNSVCVTLAVSGLLTSLIAAALMPISSLTVVALASRSRTFGGKGGAR